VRRYLVFFVVSLALLLSSIGGSAASVAFPVMISDLKTSLIMAGFVLSAYQLVVTVVMALAGKITDMLGKRTAFFTFTALFSAGSVLCALAPNVYVLIGARIIQALGGGGFMPCAAGIVSEEFPENRQRFIGLFSSIFPIGTIIGPNLGGWMVQSFGWRSIFWFNVPLGIVVLVLSWALLPGGQRRTRTTIDSVGAGLLFGALGALMFAFTEFDSSPLPVVKALAVIGAGLLYAFVRWEKRAREPIIDLDLLRQRPFLAANIYNTLYGIAALGIFSMVPLYAVSVYNMTVLESGVLLTPRSVGMIAASTITSFSLVKWGYRRPILAGTLLVGACLAGLALQPHGISLFGPALGVTPLLYLIMALCGVGHGMATPAANNACIELMPDKVATITGLRGMFRNLGSAIGIAGSTVIINSVHDMQRAYYFVFLASVAVLLFSIPFVFVMPASAIASPERAALDRGH
jgi:EmrB/QacA subfamily drug resistance transporter